MATKPKVYHYCLSDLHLGHDKILSFCRPWFKTIQDHDDYIIEQINKTCTNQDYLWLLGDVAFTRDGLMRLKEVKCRLALIGGNHDEFSADTYLRVFEQIRGVAQLNVTKDQQKKSVLLSHIPMHPDQMRWDYNIHGHLHTYHVGEEKYINVSCEPMAFTPKKISDLLKLEETNQND